jgi:Ca-activated chloride channel family protein
MKEKHVRIGTIAFLFLLVAGVMLGAQAPVQAPPQQPPTQTLPQQTPPPPGPPPANQDPRYRLAVEVELVNLTATVYDESGKYLEGLGLGDFQVFEDGEEQKISFFSHDQRVPISVGVLVDASGSMRHKLQQALQTVREIASAISPQDEMFLIDFNSEVRLRQRFTSNTAEIQKALREIRSSGETAAYDAIQLANEEMKSARHNKKIMLLVTDGFDTKSKINAAQVEEILKKSDVLVYAIGIDDDDDDPLVMRRTRYHIYHYMLNRLAGLSGGRTYRLFTGRNYALQSLAQVLLEELHQQYTLSYYPTSTREADAWRKVEIKVSKPSTQIRHRTGYYVKTGNQQ